MARSNAGRLFPRKGFVMKLRNLGIYTLPDGNEYVVDVLYNGGYSLYPRNSWETVARAAYRISSDGSLVRRGKPSRWNVGQLRFTGRKAHYPRVARLI